MPSLWAAVAGDCPVADAHDDPGHVTWGWKDAWTLAASTMEKILRRKATIISTSTSRRSFMPSANCGSPEEDYLYQYQDGTMTAEAKAIYEVLLRGGPLNAVASPRRLDDGGNGEPIASTGAWKRCRPTSRCCRRRGAGRGVELCLHLRVRASLLPGDLGARSGDQGERAQRTLLRLYVRSVGRQFR